jgi:hypothetical protein
MAVLSWGTGKPDGADTVSGDYVNITSGINLQVDISGDPVTISGDHIYVESGNVVGISGQAVIIGEVFKTHTDEWSGFIGSGDIVVASGADVSKYQKVGLYVQASGSIVVTIQASYDDTSGNYCDYNGYDPVVSGLTGCKRYSLGDYPFEYVRAKVENMGASGSLNIRWARAT